MSLLPKGEKKKEEEEEKEERKKKVKVKFQNLSSSIQIID